MMVDSTRLKTRAKECGLRQKDIADRLGLRQSTINQKINNVRPMSLEEAEKLAEILGIEDDMFLAYFFAR